MEKETTSNLDEEKLKACINKLREVLNEMCCSMNDPETSMKKLMVSQQLDQLIVEYMGLKKPY